MQLLLCDFRELCTCAVILQLSVGEAEFSSLHVRAAEGAAVKKRTCKRAGPRACGASGTAQRKVTTDHLQAGPYKTTWSDE